MTTKTTLEAIRKLKRPAQNPQDAMLDLRCSSVGGWQRSFVLVHAAVRAPSDSTCRGASGCRSNQWGPLAGALTVNNKAQRSVAGCGSALASGLAPGAVDPPWRSPHQRRLPAGGSPPLPAFDAGSRFFPSMLCMTARCRTVVDDTTRTATTHNLRCSTEHGVRVLVFVHI